ncbi:MAG: hypothetical protein MI723_01940 [Caulobacterales bacterium]|nr:hypothetical protein [Caulobacterales bacterium]
MRTVRDERVTLATDLFQSMAKGRSLAAFVSPIEDQKAFAGGLAARFGLIVGDLFMPCVAHAILGLLEDGDD